MAIPKIPSNSAQSLTFASNNKPTVGVELELQLVDRETMALKSAILDLQKELGTDQEWLKQELMQSYVEVNTGVCHRVDEVRQELTQHLILLQAAAEKCDTDILWAGSHPFSSWMDQDISPQPRYEKLVDSLQDIARRIVTFGMHVHVGVDSGDKAVMLVDRLMRYLSTLLALSVNSPFWVGRKTGLHSQRTKIMEQLPASGTPPFLRNYSEYCWVINHSLESGFINSIQEIWWDVRPHPKYGTVEIRIFDLPPSLNDVLALTALTQCLVTTLSEQIDEGIYQHDIHPIMVRQNKWTAARYGLDAKLIDPVTHKTIPVREMVAYLHDQLSPIATNLHCISELDYLLKMIKQPSGAERQLQLYDELNGNMPAMVKELLKFPAFPYP